MRAWASCFNIQTALLTGRHSLALRWFFSPSQPSEVPFAYSPSFCGGLRFVLSFSVCVPSLLLCCSGTNRITFFQTFLFTSGFCLRDLCATFLFTSSFQLRVWRTPPLTRRPANGSSVFAAPWLVAVQRAPAMPLVERILGLNAELAGSQSWPEAADVVKRGV